VQLRAHQDGDRQARLWQTDGTHRRACSSAFCFVRGPHSIRPNLRSRPGPAGIDGVDLPRVSVYDQIGRRMQIDEDEMVTYHDSEIDACSQHVHDTYCIWDQCFFKKKINKLRTKRPVTVTQSREPVTMTGSSQQRAAEILRQRL
jgi:hypothetical protein